MSDQAQIQEAASIFATINYDSTRLMELNFGEFETLAVGVINLLGTQTRKLNMRLALLMSRVAKDATTETTVELVEAALRERFVLQVLEKYRP